MANTYIEWEPGWENKAWHYRSSLNPLGNAVREATNQIHRQVLGNVNAELARWQNTANTTQNLARKGRTSDRLRFFRAKAMAYSLRKYAALLRPIMVHAGDQNFGAVAAFHAAGKEIEFGGKDARMELGKTGEYLQYPAFAFLRKGLH